MADGGYVKLHRRILEWGWFDDACAFRLFIYLLLTVNWESKSWHGREILPGQLVTSRAKLALETGLSEQATRTALTRLKSTGEITIESTSHFTVVTVTKWALYQTGDDESTSKSTSRATSNQPAANQPLTSNQPQLKKEKKVRREEVKKYGDSDASLEAAFGSYREMRGALRKKLTAHGEQMVRKKLEDIAPNDPVKQAAILNQSTMFGWTGLFPLKVDNAAPAKGKKKDPAGNFAQREYSDEYLDSMYDEVPKVSTEELKAVLEQADDDAPPPEEEET